MRRAAEPGNCPISWIRPIVTDLRAKLFQSAQPRKFFKFLIVGLFNTAFGYSLFALIYLLTGSYRIAVVLATCVGIAFNFYTTGRLVFGNRRLAACLPFILGYAIVCVIDILGLDALARAGLGAILAQLFLLPFLVILSYLINNRLVFVEKRS
jgi:putative flippase GtrA